MNGIDYPNISNQRSTEDNMLQAKTWMNQISDLLNYQLNYMNSKIEALEKRVEELEGKDNA